MSQEITKVKVLTIHKIVYDNEELCPDCGGFNVIPTETPRGVDLVRCSSCLDGVRKCCGHCKQLLVFGRRCQCEGARASNLAFQHKQKSMRWHSAKKMPLDAAKEVYRQFYIDSLERYVTYDELMEIATTECGGELPEWVYATTTASIAIDANAVVENACEELYEEAEASIDKQKMQELQELLSQWCRSLRQETKTYYPDYKIAIVLPKEDAHE